ncbi:MFS transporter [Catalinimonas niigatensis]|uniref:MFS transporter n=1 Tax=Catalinimonas niigatensis TaxID=1397264 RepID=UPI002665E610|nr:MFS transporter [Catalinimonas niigatensis]WPP49872.1 MFS transporter [Catalinimonas niigatensis]
MSDYKSIYNLQFGLLCLSSFLFFSSFNMIIPELPSYLESLGGGEYKGLIIALFTLTAGLSRPFSGKLADKVGRIPVMIFGAVVCFICGFLYPIASSVFLFLLLRFFHGFSTGFKPTGTSAYVADVVSASRRGEAMGVLGLCGSLGMASGPAIGSLVANHFSLDMMFYSSSVAAILSIVILAGMKETLEDRHAFRVSFLKLNKEEIFEPRVIAPCIVLLLTAFSFGIVLTITPDFSDTLGIKNRGLFFTFFTIASVAVRFFAGKASDKYGRIQVLKVSTILLAIGMLMLGLADSIPLFLTSAIVFGLATGMNTPTIFAWTIDLSHEKHRGRGMATMYIALEAGIGLGALLSGWIYGNDSGHFVFAYGLGAVLALLAFVYLFFLPKAQLATSK